MKCWRTNQYGRRNPHAHQVLEVITGPLLAPQITQRPTCDFQLFFVRPVAISLLCCSTSQMRIVFSFVDDSFTKDRVRGGKVAGGGNIGGLIFEVREENDSVPSLRVMGNDRYVSGMAIQSLAA